MNSIKKLITAKSLCILSYVFLGLAMFIAIPETFTVFGVFIAILKSVFFSLSFCFLLYMTFMADDDMICDELYKKMCELYSANMKGLSHNEYFKVYHIMSIILKSVALILAIIALVIL